MRLIKLFVASSNELADDRVHLGDCVRRVNDIYEPNGVRVKLYKWEDFVPYYTGRRSQDEYNAYLSHCDAVIGLFKEKLGKYTCEEIEVALDKLGREKVFCYVKTTGAGDSIPDNITEFFIAKGIDSHKYQDTTVFGDIVRNIVDVLLKNKTETTSQMPTSCTYLYATIPDDNDEMRHQVGDIVRELDDKREELHNDRCRLFQYRDSDKIAKSNAYMAIMKNAVALEDENEIKIAKRELGNSNLEAIFVYHEQGGLFKNSSLWDQINDWGYFMPEYKSISDVRWHLNEYLDRRKAKCTNDYVVDKGFLFANGIKIGDIQDISAFNHDNKVFTKSQQVEKLRGEQSYRVSDLGQQIYDKSDDILVDLSYDINDIDSELQKCVLMPILAQSIHISELYDREYQTLITECNKLSKTIFTDIQKGIVNEGDIFVQIDAHIRLSENLFKIGALFKEKYFEIQSSWLMLYDKYYRRYPLHLYESIVEYADKYQIVNLRSEELREQISCFYNQNGDIINAIRLHRISLDNYRKIDDGSTSFRRRLNQSYLDYCSIFLNHELYDQLPALKQAFDEWGKMVHSWFDESDAFLPELGDYLSVMIRIQNMWSCFEKEHFISKLPFIHEVFMLLQARFDALSNRAKGNFLYLGDMLITLYLDHPGEYTSIKESFSRCQDYIDQTINNALKYYMTNAVDSLFWLSMLYHNNAFLQSKTGNLNESVNYYEKALDYRRQMLRKRLYTNSHDEVGETLVNYGDVLRQLHEYPRAIDAAKEAIEIYECSKDSSVQKLELHDMNIYKSKQLLGSIYYEAGDDYFEKGIELLKEVWSWASAHPDNTYMGSFKGTSWRILKQEGRI